MGKHSSPLVAPAQSSVHSRPQWVKTLSLLSVVLMVGTLVVLGLMKDRTAAPTQINSDMLGPDTSESLDEYEQRAEQTFKQLVSHDQQRDTSDVHYWAMVTFRPAKDSADAASTLTTTPPMRVARIILSATFDLPIPNPSENYPLSRLIQRERDRVQQINSLEPDDPRLTVSGAVVWATAEQLEHLRQQPGVFALEVLPADAQAGHFGTRPVDVYERQDPPPA